VSEQDSASANRVEPQSTDAMFDEVYQRLKGMASRHRARSGDATLNTTAIVHEAYLRISEEGALTFADPAQFFGYAARAMRSILVDAARRRLCRQRIGLDGGTDIERAAASAADASAEHALEIDAAMQRLQRDDPRAARLVELHYFGGLTYQELSETLKVSEATVDREIRLAKAWMLKEIRPLRSREPEAS